VTEPPPLALELAEWSAALRWDAVPADVRERVRLWVLDALGLVLAGSTIPAGRAILEIVRHQGGRPEATVVGLGDRAPAVWAAFAHGAFAHGLDFDDTFPGSLVHPGSLVVPAALAVAESVSADGGALGAAVAAGYEVAARLGAPAGSAFHARGFQATSVVGPLVAALVAGKLYRLSPRTTAEAMGLAGSMAGGLLEFLSDGSWAKRVHPGWAAHGGIVAAQLAAAGVPGPPSVLEGRYGLYAAFLGTGTADLGSVLDGLGVAWRAREARAKLYPCAHVIHPFLDAARAVTGRDADALDVEAVVCHVEPWQVPLVCEPRAEKIAPRSEYQARASLPYCLAAALVDGRVDMETFAPAAIARPDFLAMAARVTHREPGGAPAGSSPPAARAAAGAPGATIAGAALEITLRGGRRLTPAVSAERVPGPEAVRAKFARTAGRRLPADRAAALAAAVTGLPATTAAELLARCTNPVTPARRDRAAPSS